MRSINLRMETNLNSLLKNKLDELKVLEEEYELCKQVRFMHNRDLAHAHVFSKSQEIISILKSNYDKL